MHFRSMDQGPIAAANTHGADSAHEAYLQIGAPLSLLLCPIANGEKGVQFDACESFETLLRESGAAATMSDQIAIDSDDHRRGSDSPLSLPRVRNLRTRGSCEWASSSFGSPVAICTLESASRNTQVLPIAKMLASS